MATTTFVHVPRQLDGPSPPTPKPPFTIRWKILTYILAPLLLALGNLLEARFEKLRGFQVGAYKHQEFRGRGEAVQAAAVRAATDKGNARYAALIAQAQNEGRAEIEIGRKERETNISQGNDKGTMQEGLANGMILALFGRTEEIARLVHERSEMEVGARYGRYLKVDYKTGQFEVQEVAANEQAHVDMVERLFALSHTKGQALDALKERSISDGARELATFAGSNCASGGSHD